MQDSKAIIREYSTPLTLIPTNLSPSQPSMGPIKCLALDIYGTILISERQDCQAAWKSLIDKFDLPAPSESLQGLIEREHKFARERGIEFPEVEIRDLWKELFPNHDPELLALHFELLSHKVWPMPGLDIPANLSLAIVSNAQFYTPLILDALCPIPAKPAFTFYSYQHRVAKPGPELFEKLRESIQERDILPSEVAFLGNDHHKDILPAKQIGFQTILFAGDQRSLAYDPALEQPDAIITHLSQLFSLFEVSSLTS